MEVDSCVPVSVTVGKVVGWLVGKSVAVGEGVLVGVGELVKLGVAVRVPVAVG